MLKLGCITDDFAGARDLGLSLVSAGMRVIQTLGVPHAPLDTEADGVVVTLKSRYASPGDAVFRALDALVWLKSQGVSQICFCFSPTFDSLFAGEVRGNIGPVVEALMDALGTDFTVVVPSFPEQDCAVLKGHLFVGQLLLSESTMASNPRTPMTDANLLRVLRAQTRREVGLIDHVRVSDSSVSIQERMVELRLKHVGIALVDAASNDDLLRISLACKGMPLIACSPGLARGLPYNFGIEPSVAASRLPAAVGLRAVVCGSCSEASNRQVQYFHAAGHPAMALDPLKIAKFGSTKVAEAAMAWAEPLLASGPILLYSTADEDSLGAVQSLLGVDKAASLVEQCMGEIAVRLVERGVRQLIVAGSDTGAACLRGLRVRQMQIGPQIDPGVPWYYSQLDTPLEEGAEPDGLHLTIKPGSRGSDDFFTRAFDWMR